MEIVKCLQDFFLNYEFTQQDLVVEKMQQEVAIFKEEARDKV